MKEEIKNLIKNELKELKEGIGDQLTYNHIIASILEIHTEQLSYVQVLDQLEKDIDNLTAPENGEIWGNVYSLATLINVSSPVIRCTYYEAIPENEEEWKMEIAGEIYDFMYQNS